MLVHSRDFVGIPQAISLAAVRLNAIGRMVIDLQVTFGPLMFAMSVPLFWTFHLRWRFGSVRPIRRPSWQGVVLPVVRAIVRMSSPAIRPAKTLLASTTMCQSKEGQAPTAGECRT